jgi:hypothetical protein
LKVLRFGDEFNQPIDKNVFPPSLKVFEFGQLFNQSIGIDVWPQSLRELKIDNRIIDLETL